MGGCFIHLNFRYTYPKHSVLMGILLKIKSTEKTQQVKRVLASRFTAKTLGLNIWVKLMPKWQYLREKCQESDLSGGYTTPKPNTLLCNGIQGCFVAYSPCVMR